MLQPRGHPRNISRGGGTAKSFTLEGGGENGVSPPDAMGIWQVTDDGKPEPLAMQHRKALQTHESESLEAAEMWATIGELARGILGPAKCRAHALDEKSATGAPIDATWLRDNQDWQVTPTEFQRPMAPFLRLRRRRVQRRTGA
jgi:hypothetical protein